MKMRAIVLGAVIGFAVAVVPSCGGAKCSTTNCAGCCDAKGACVGKPNNGNNTTCGNQGHNCADCSKTAQVCSSVTFACGTGTGGGAGGGSGGGAGGGTSCDGCALPSSGACVPLSNTTVNNCGVGGATCQACQAGQLCTNGVCQTPSSTAKVGDPCNNTSDCAAIDAGISGTAAYCKKMTSSGNASYTGGYCTYACGAGTPIGTTNCPSGSRCVTLLPRYGESDSFCWDLCNPSAGDNCRSPGYDCYDLSAFSACWLSPLPPQDAGPPADKVGNPCDAGTECINPPETGGGCLTATLPDGGPSGYVGGYCTMQQCQSHDDCSPDGGALCLAIDSAGNTACFSRCAASNAGQSTCRQGYACNQYFGQLPDGGTQASSDGYCDPNCNNVSGYCGVYPDGGVLTCTANGYCQP